MLYILTYMYIYYIENKNAFFSNWGGNLYKMLRTTYFIKIKNVISYIYVLYIDISCHLRVLVLV